MEESRNQGKVYEFVPRKNKKLKTLDYVSPQKKLLLEKRKEAQRDKRNFYIGSVALLMVVIVFTFLRLK